LRPAQTPQVADDDAGRRPQRILFDRTAASARATRRQRDAANGRFARGRSVSFGLNNRSAPLTLTTPGGRTLLLRGIIDRVDVAELTDELLGTVIDYKHTTDRKLDLTQVYHGLALQLVGYLLALEQLGESLTGRPIRPVAAFYLPLIEPYKSLDHPTTSGPRRSGGGIADVSRWTHSTAPSSRGRVRDSSLRD
jgi:hypothetical protein